MELGDSLPVDITHPAWQAGIGTLVGYGLILILIFFLLFLVPSLIFAAV